MAKVDTLVLGDLVFNTPSDTATIEDIIDCLDGNIGYWRKQNVIWDFKNFNFDNVSVDQFISYVDIAKDVLSFGGSMKTAFVVNCDMIFGKLSILTNLAKQNHLLEMGTFKTVDDARAWIDGHRQLDSLNLDGLCGKH